MTKQRPLNQGYYLYELQYVNGQLRSNSATQNTAGSYRDLRDWWIPSDTSPYVVLGPNCETATTSWRWATFLIDLSTLPTSVIPGATFDGLKLELKGDGLPTAFLSGSFDAGADAVRMYVKYIAAPGGVIDWAGAEEYSSVWCDPFINKSGTMGKTQFQTGEPKGIGDPNLLPGAAGGQKIWSAAGMPKASRLLVRVGFNMDPAKDVSLYEINITGTA